MVSYGRLCLLWSSLDSGGCQISPVASPASGRSVCLLASAAAAVGTCVVTKFCVWMSVARWENSCNHKVLSSGVICWGWDLCNHKVPVSSDLRRNPCGHKVPLPYSLAVPGGKPLNRPGLLFVVPSWWRVVSVQ